MDASLIAEFDHAANKLAGKNRSEFLAETARQLIA
jgi:metal-responsive CopG/Arc/MetJ family transcriptional regulator